MTKIVNGIGIILLFIYSKAMKREVSHLLTNTGLYFSPCSFLEFRSLAVFQVGLN